MCYGDLPLVIFDVIIITVLVFLIFFFFLFFWFGGARQHLDSSSQSEVDPAPSMVEARSANHHTTREVPWHFFILRYVLN